MRWTAAEPAAIRAIALVCLAGAVGCEPQRTEYVYRPSFMREGEQSASLTRADGTRMVFTDEPFTTDDHKGEHNFALGAEREPVVYPTINSLQWRGTPPAKAPPPTPLKIREETDRGEVILRAITPDHVLSHLVNALREQEYKPLYDCILSEQARIGFESKGGYPAFVEWCDRNREPALETLNRMGFGMHNSEVIIVKTGPQSVTARLAPQVAGAFRFKELNMSYQGGAIRLDGLR
ncbi:MAG: hypothetical protein EXS00_00805 [Phycisphaerales bacterium]|nr:hypothetical protein [Phycisphaerales bacterium]